MKSFITKCLLLTALIIACSKSDQNKFLTSNEVLENYIEKNKEEFFVEAQSGRYTLRTKDGCYIQIQEDGLLKNAQRHVGKIKVEVTAIFEKHQMLEAGLPTVFQDWSNQFHPLKSGGEILVKAFDPFDNVALYSDKPYFISIPNQITDPTEYHMNLFVLDKSDGISWRSPTDTNLTSVDMRESIFRFYPKHFRWYNIDKTIDIGVPKYELKVKYPSGINKSHANCFINLVRLPNSLLDPRILLPENELCQAFLITHTEEKVLVYYEDFLMEKDKTIDFSRVEMKVIDKGDLNSYLINTVK